MPKSEAKFFRALERVVGVHHLKAKSLGRKVSSKHVFLDRDYTRYTFPKGVLKKLTKILQDLRSTADTSPGSLSHYIDGLLAGHPLYGTRIVEFDEEQHFNTFRYVTLQHLTADVPQPPTYAPRALEHCVDVVCFNRMLRKHQLRVSIDSVPQDIRAFLELVKTHARPKNGYIEPKPAFDYLGGRIAQRAYYDALRDVAHCAKQNNLLATALRFTLFEFEEMAGCQFQKIRENDLCCLVEARLAELV